MNSLIPKKIIDVNLLKSKFNDLPISVVLESENASSVYIIRGHISSGYQKMVRVKGRPSFDILERNARLHGEKIENEKFENDIPSFLFLSGMADKGSYAIYKSDA
jgi:hypothetical protein